MVLSELWQKSPEALDGKHVQQVIMFAGEGKLLDGSHSSEDFRQFLALIPSQMLAKYAVECITEAFDGNGFALQDIVNQVGERLGFTVEYGRYRGTPGKPGQDGLWLIGDGRAIVVEVKTTAAYTVDLETQVGYRKLLGETRGDVATDATSILMVVGRQETGSLEAQIRGSRHAWDIRIISVEALLRLLDLQEKLDDPDMLAKVTRILVPQEYTKVDAIIDLVFSTAEEASTEVGPAEETDGSEVKEKPQPAHFHDDCLKRIEKKLGFSLTRKSKSKYSSADGKTRVTLAVSRSYKKAASTGFWYAFHPPLKEFLSGGETGIVAFGAGDASTIFLVPFDVFAKLLPNLNVTDNGKRMFWHVRIETGAAGPRLLTTKGHQKVDMSCFLL